MTREAYLRELRAHLEAANFPHVEEALSYYAEMLEDRMADENMDEEAAIALLENPAQAASHLGLHFERSSEAKAQESEHAPDSSPGVRTIRMKANALRSLIVQDRNNSLVLEGWDRDEVEISFPETEKIRYETSLLDGVFSLIRTPMEFSLSWFNFDVFNPQMRQVMMRVPHELAAALDLKTSNSKIQVEKVSCWGQMLLKTSNSSIDLFQVEAKGIIARTSNSSITLNQVKAQKTLEAITSNSRVTAKGVVAPESLVIHTSNGKIEVSGIQSQAISLITSNGSIKGILPGTQGEYSISSRTSNGKNNLPREQQGGPYSLITQTSNAKIELAFEG